jgi:hypothetical protein
VASVIRRKDMPVKSSEDIRTAVRERYARAAKGGSLCCGPSCCGPDVNQMAQQIGYRPEDLARLPEGANLGLGCGNPLEQAARNPGRPCSIWAAGPEWTVCLRPMRSDLKGM